MTEVFLCASRRTPIGRYSGALAMLSLGVEQCGALALHSV